MTGWTSKALTARQSFQRCLNLPVPLIADRARSTAMIAAIIIAGIQKFEGGVEIKGALSRTISQGSRHESIIRNS